MTQPDGTSDDREFVLTRTLDAPRELVFQAWTDPQHIARWWGPQGMTTSVTEMDLRPGGSWRYVMAAPDGSEFPLTGVFSEVVPNERIVTTGFDDQNVSVTVIFEEHEGRTTLTLRVLHESAEVRQAQQERRVDMGWNSNFDSLEAYLARP